MRKLFFAFASLMFISMAQGQGVGVGTTTPPAKLTVVGSPGDPSIPNTTSTGLFRIGVSDYEGIDLGKMGSGSFAGWIQAGYSGLSDPISLQPMGGNVGIGTLNPSNMLSVAGNADFSGNVGIGTTNPGATLEVAGTLKITGGTPGAGKVLISDATGLASWVSLNPSADALPTIQIGTQKWMSKNLDVAFYRNGDPIPQVTDPTAWAALTTGAWCYNNNDPTQGTTYGKLYNWYAVNDPRGLAPRVVMFPAMQSGLRWRQLWVVHQ